MPKRYVPYGGNLPPPPEAEAVIHEMRLYPETIALIEEMMLANPDMCEEDFMRAMVDVYHHSMREKQPINDIFPEHRDFFVYNNHIWVKCNRYLQALGKTQARPVFYAQYSRMCLKNLRAEVLLNPEEHGLVIPRNVVFLDLEDTILFTRTYPPRATYKGHDTINQLTTWGKIINFLREYDRYYERYSYEKQCDILGMFLEKNPGIHDQFEQSNDVTLRYIYKRPPLKNEDPNELRKRAEDAMFNRRGKLGRPKGSRNKKPWENNEDNHASEQSQLEAWRRS